MVNEQSRLKEVIYIMLSRRTERNAFDSFGEVVAGALRGMGEVEANAARVQFIGNLFPCPKQN